MRVGLSQEPKAFVANARVGGLLHAFGDSTRNAVLANGAVLAHGRYPSREELAGALAPQGTTPVAAPVTRRSALLVVDPDEASYTPGFGCC